MTETTRDSYLGGPVLRNRWFVVAWGVWALIALAFTIAYVVELISKGQAGYAVAAAVFAVLAALLGWTAGARVEADPTAQHLVVRNPWGRRVIAWSEVETADLGGLTLASHWVAGVVRRSARLTLRDGSHVRLLAFGAATAGTHESDARASRLVLELNARIAQAQRRAGR